MNLNIASWQQILYYPEYYFDRADTTIQIYFRCDAPNELVSIKSSQVRFENVRPAVFIIPDKNITVLILIIKPFGQAILYPYKVKWYFFKGNYDV